MANGIEFSSFGHFADHTLAHYKNRPMFDMAFNLQNYAVVDEWFGSDDKYTVKSGNQIEWRVLLGHNGSARMVLPSEVMARNHTDNLKKATAPWVTCAGVVTYNQQIADSVGSDAELADYMKSNYATGIQSYLELLDAQGFAVPDDSSDGRNARGVPYWVNMLDTGTTDYTGSFSGKTLTWGDGTTTTTIGAISKTTEALWRNWACNYSGTVDQALVDAIVYGLLMTQFKPPKEIGQYAKAKTPRRRIFWSIAAENQYQRLRNAGNDDRNGDVQPFAFNQLKTLSSVPTVPVAQLNDRAYSPIYVLDMPNFFPFVKQGWYMKRYAAMNDVEQPDDWTVYIKTQFNFGCTMPRNQAVFHTPT